MTVAKLSAAAISLSLLLGITASSLQVQARYTITQRQEALQWEIKKGQKSGELTKKEADGLRAKLDGVRERIAKMKEKNGGKLSYKDEGKIEGELNGISTKIHKLELAKRVQPH